MPDEIIEIASSDFRPAAGSLVGQRGRVCRKQARQVPLNLSGEERFVDEWARRGMAEATPGKKFNGRLTLSYEYVRQHAGIPNNDKKSCEFAGSIIKRSTDATRH